MIRSYTVIRASAMPICSTQNQFVCVLVWTNASIAPEQGTQIRFFFDDSTHKIQIKHEVMHKHDFFLGLAWWVSNESTPFPRFFLIEDQNTKLGHHAFFFASVFERPPVWDSGLSILSPEPLSPMYYSGCGCFSPVNSHCAITILAIFIKFF